MLHLDRVVNDPEVRRDCWLSVNPDELIMLAAMARECGIREPSDDYAAQTMIRAIAHCFFTVVREYDQVFEGVDVTLSPSEWVAWAETGQRPSAVRKIEIIRDLLDRLSELDNRAKDALR